MHSNDEVFTHRVCHFRKWNFQLTSCQNQQRFSNTASLFVSVPLKTYVWSETPKNSFPNFYQLNMDLPSTHDLGLCCQVFLLPSLFFPYLWRRNGFRKKNVKDVIVLISHDRRPANWQVQRIYENETFCITYHRQPDF